MYIYYNKKTLVASNDSTVNFLALGRTMVSVQFAVQETMAPDKVVQ